MIALIHVNASASETKNLKLSISNGSVLPAENTHRFRKGERITIEWRSDSAVELHLHGYDIKTKIIPGTPSTMVFDATITGRFAVKMHAGSGHSHNHAKSKKLLSLGSKEKAVLYIEVHP